MAKRRPPTSKPTPRAGGDGDDNPVVHYEKTTVPLPAAHNWKCSPGHLLFIANRGDLRFEYPETWHVILTEKSLNIHDRPPPDDEARLQLTIMPTPHIRPADYPKLPLVDVLRSAVDRERDEKGDRWERLGDMNTIERPGLQIAWTESRWYDQEHAGRPVLCRQLFTRGRGIHILMTYDYYEDVAEKHRPVWTHLVQTMRVSTPVNLLGEVQN